MSTIEAETPQTDTDEQPDEQPVQTNESSAVAELSREELFQWNTWVHAGHGAGECALAKAVSDSDYKVGMEIPLCAEDGHFHAWIRLPNPLQRRDIVDKATAAQARKARELRDPESDGAVILDNEIDLIRASGDTEQLVQEIVERHFQEDLSEATNEVMDMEDDQAEDDDEGGEAPLKYQHVDQDMEELRRQEELPEDKRDGGFDRLKAHVEGYHEAIDERMKAIQDRRAEGLRERGLDHLLTLVRADRASLVTTETYIHTYNVWQWFTCTYKPKAKGTPNEKIWGDINHMRLAPPEVIGVLRARFDDLDRNLINSRRAKNS